MWKKQPIVDARPGSTTSCVYTGESCHGSYLRFRGSSGSEWKAKLCAFTLGKYFFCGVKKDGESHPSSVPASTGAKVRGVTKTNQMSITILTLVQSVHGDPNGAPTQIRRPSASH